MNGTNKKIAGGVIALLAVVSLTQTQAILKLAKAANVNKTSAVAMVDSESQEASGGNSLSNPNACIQVAPSDGNHTTFIDPDINPYNNNHSYTIGFKIKNICNTEVSIIDDFDSSDAYGNGNGGVHVAIAKVEDFMQTGTDSIAWVYAGGGPRVRSTDSVDDTLPQEFIIPSSNIDNVLATIGGADDHVIQGYNIAPSSERNFYISFTVWGNYENIQHRTRIILKKFRWFKTSAYSDSVLSAGEVKTYNLSDANSKLFSTSYAMFNDPYANMTGVKSKSKEAVIQEVENRLYKTTQKSK